LLVDRATLHQHREAIQQDEKGWFVWGELERLSTACHVYHATGQTDRDMLYRHITAVTTHVQDLRTTVAKLDWMRELRDVGQLDSYTWIYFAATDVVSFLTNVRSMFDRLSRAMRAVANQPANVPLLSFNDLQKWLAKPQVDREVLGGDLATLVEQTRDWFEVLRDVRDELIHYDARALVFPGAGIGVQVYAGVRLLLPDDSSLMLNQNVVDFRYFAAAVMARVYVLLEDASKAILARAGFARGGEGWHHNPGLGILADWTDQLIAALSDGR
jgi:hypothetical protein